MISFEHAKQIAIEKIGPQCGLAKEATVEKPYGWYFMYQSEKWFQTRNWKDGLVGSGGFIVEREDGRTYEFGSVFPLERNFAAYEYGLRYKTYDLIVTAVGNVEQAAEFLSRLGLIYRKPGWKLGRDIPLSYDREQLAERLRTLPCTFTDCRGFYFKYEQFLKLDAARCCSYELRGHREE